MQVYNDGTTNLPQPKTARKQGNVLEDLMRLKVELIELRQGWFHLGDQKTPLDVRVGGLDLKLGFDAANSRYRLEASMRETELPSGYKPSLEMSGWLETRRVLLDRVAAQTGESRVTASAELVFSPFTVTAAFEGDVRLSDVPQAGIGRGRATVSGKLTLRDGEFETNGHFDARGVGFKAGQVNVEQASLKGAYELRRDDLVLRDLSVSTAFGSGKGQARIRNWRSLEVTADLSRVNIERVQKEVLAKPYAWSGTASGPVTLKASLGGGKVTLEEVKAAATVAPAEGQVPLSGTIGVSWDRKSGALQLDGTSLSTREARVNLRGTLGQVLQVNVSTSSIRDIEPVIAMFSRDETFTLPVRLENGEATIDATVRGPLDQPRIEGHLRMNNARVDEVPFDSLDAQFEVSAERLRLSQLVLKQQEATLSGRAAVDLRNWKPDWSSLVDLSLRFDHSEIQRIMGLFRVKSPVSGVLDGTIEASGPAGAPALNLRAQGSGVKLGQEVVRKLAVTLQTKPDGDFTGQTTLDGMTAKLAGHLRHAEGDFRNGSAKVTISTPGVPLTEIETLQDAGPKLLGRFAGEMTAEASFSPEGLRWVSLDGALTAPELRVNDRVLEKVELRSSTRSGAAEVTLKCAVRAESSQVLEVRARVQMNGEPLVEGSARFPRLSFGFLREVMQTGNATGAAAIEPWPVRGFVEGEASYSLNLNNPENAKAQVTISRLQVRPRDNQMLETQVDSSELTLTNSSPVVIEVDQAKATIRPASFSAKETQLSLSGTVGLKEASAVSLRLSGGVNLAVLSTFQPELEAKGRAEIDASVRGTAADPSLSGRMTISGASFYLKDLPNGIENTNGTVFFEKNRANIEKLTGQTGGGEFQVTGFVGINEGELNYRLNARAKNIRIRYPEGVSTTTDASLDMVGSPGRSMLSGTVTILRMAFVGGGDFGEMVGGSTNPIPAPATRNEFLRNLQFDVKVRTSADATLDSSYTEGLETEANLQLRGSPSKPVLLGGVQVNQGAIKFFGNRYTISRGELLFYNTAIVQPAIDLDLETRIRGVTVYINVSGPLARLNVNYRSEPPLQSSEILALLTVGRAPAGSEGSLQASSTIRGANVLENTSSNSLLGGALNAGISNRVERFFGASRIKIDPQATGVDNVAQARLSIEQSLSRDVTVTFVTNLSRTQEQIVRLEWDVSRQWQVVAVRDENGVFAIDFLFRKRFK